MAYIVTRHRTDGPRFTVYAAGSDGRKRSLGTYGTYEEAEAHRVQADEVALLRKTGKDSIGEAYAALQSLRDYFYDESRHGYRARAGIEPSTWLGYETVMRRHVLPILGQKAVRDIRRVDVQEMVSTLNKTGVGAPTITRARKILSTVMDTLLDHNVIDTNPAFRVKTPPVRKVEKPIFQPGEVKALIAALPNEASRLYASVLIETGARQGEVSELRPYDIDWRTGTIQLTRAVSDVGDAHNPARTGRFYVKSTKGGKTRFVTISNSLLSALRSYVDSHSIGHEDLLFPVALVSPEVATKKFRGNANEPDLSPEVIESLGLTEPNAKGFRYRHGTTSGYTSGGCRCDYCKQAMRLYYRERAAKKPRKTKSNGSRTNLTGHLPRDVWYDIWYDACTKAGISFHVAPHSLRHSFATWMLKAGKDLRWVQDRMGHASITTTEVYLHRIEAEDRSGSDIMEGLLA